MKEKPELPPKNIPHKQDPIRDPNEDNPINPKEDVPNDSPKMETDHENNLT